MVGARLAQVDGGHGLARLGRHAAQAKARIHHDGRADHQQGAGRVHLALGLGRAGGGYAVAEEHHVRLQGAAAAGTDGQVEGGQLGRFQQGVAIGRRRGRGAQHLRIVAFELILDQAARVAGLAIEAYHAMYAAVQLRDGAAACLLMQTIDVLRDQAADVLALCQLRDGQVSGIGRGARQGRPAHHAARPVAAAHGFLAAKIGALHGRVAAPHAVRIAVVGYAGRRADAGARQQQHVGMALQELRQLLQGGIVAGRWQAG